MMKEIPNFKYPYSQRNVVAIRHENVDGIDLILWSKSLDNYFYVDDAKILEDVKKVIIRKREGFKNIYFEIDSFLKEDLTKMGFDGEMIEFNNPIKGRLSSPLESYFDYNTNCNLDCCYCYNRKGEYDISRGYKIQEQMSIDNIKLILNTLRENGVMRNHLAGGEPTINLNHLRVYLETSKELGLNQSIVTNGTLLGNDKKGKEACEIIMYNDLISATISVEGNDEKDFIKARGKDNWSIVINGTKNLIKHRNGSKARTAVQWRKVWDHDSSILEIERIIKKGLEIGLDAIQFHCPERSLYHPSKHYGKIIDEYYDVSRKIRELQQKYEEQILIWNVWNPVLGCEEIGIPRMYGCVGAQELIAIHPTGGLSPCLMNHEYLGNLFIDWDGNLGNFWKESNLLSKFQGFTSEPDPHCIECQALDYCRGGSVVRRKVEHGGHTNKIKTEIPILEVIVSKPLWVGKRDPFCPKDYCKENKVSMKKMIFPTTLKTSAFKTIVVAHSL